MVFRGLRIWEGRVKRLGYLGIWSEAGTSLDRYVDFPQLSRVSFQFLFNFCPVLCCPTTLGSHTGHT